MNSGADTGMTSPPLPPEMCHNGPKWTNAAPAFHNGTNDWGLGDVTGKRLATGDLDGDGYADLVVWQDVTNARTDFSLPPERWNVRVFMNRPRENGAPGRRFVDATRQSNFLALRDGTMTQGRLVQAVSLADIDNDGDVDVYTGTMPNAMPPSGQPRDPGDRGEVMLNDGHGSFAFAPMSDATPDSGSSPQTIGAVYLDYDADGRLDLYVGYQSETFGLPIGQQSQLFRGEGDGRFTEMTDQAGLTLESTAASLTAVTNNRPLYGLSACDVNNDGRLDLIGAAYGREWNLLFTSMGDRFVDESVRSGVGGDDNRDPSDNQTYRCYCEMNPGRCPATVPPHAAWFTCGGRGTWRPGVDDAPWRLNGNTFSIACGDVDNDGDIDLYTGEIAHPDVGSNSDHAELLVNDSMPAGPTHFNRPDRASLGLSIPARGGDEGVLTNAFFDFDNDGRLDIWAGGSDYPNMYGWLFHQNPDGHFTEVSIPAGIRHACPVGTAIADFDHDGDLDVILGTSLARSCSASWMGRASLRFYENNSSDRNWLSLTLVGTGAGGANRSAVGARVRVTSGGVTQTREVQGNWGLAGVGAELTTHFGLGAQCTVDRVEVRWPDAMSSVEVFTGVQANYRVELRQGEGHARYLQ